MLKFRCKNCDQKIGVPDDWRGHIVRCPRCKQGVDVPQNAELVNKPLPAARSAPAKSDPAKAPAPAPLRVAPVANTESEPLPAPQPAVESAPASSLPSLEPIVKSAGAAIVSAAVSPIEAVAPIPVVFESVVIAPSPAVIPLPIEPEKPEPGILQPVSRPAETKQSAPIDPAPTPTKPVKKPAKKTKAEAKANEPKVPAPAPAAVETSPVKEPAPLTPRATPIATEEPAPPDPAVVMVTVARRDEPEPSPLADPESGNVVNLAEALTQSVVTPKPIVTSASTSHFSSVFSSGAAPETIEPIIDVESSPTAAPVAVTIAGAVSVSTSPPSEPESIVTSMSMDPFTPFEESESQSDPFVEPAGSNRALSEIVDVLPNEDQSPEGLSTATDLLDTLSRTSHDMRSPDGPIDVEFEPSSARRPTLQYTLQKPVSSSASVAVASLAMLSATASLGFCVTRSHAHFAVPVGVAGLLLAVLATVVAQRRSFFSTVVGIGAAVASTMSITIAVLIGLGVLPGSASYSRMQLARHLPAARAGDIVVRVRSASVLHPVLLTSPKRVGPTAQTATQTVLRVEVELKNVSDHAAAQYTSWAVTSSRTEAVWLHDAEGNYFKPLSASGAVPPGRATEVVTLQPKGGTVGDVLLFEAPPTQVRELDLQLPGNNVGSLEPLQLHIPAEMFARQ